MAPLRPLPVPRRRRDAVGSLAAAVLLAALASGCGADAGPARSPRATVGDGNLLVATLGDSITAGTPRWDPDPQVRSGIDEPDPRHQWQYWAARRHPQLRFRNCGVNRERTDEIAARLASCVRGADVLVVQGGINDLAQGRSVEDALDSMREMVRDGQRAGARVLVAEVLPWNAGFPDYANRIRRINEGIGKLAAREGAGVLPFYSTLDDPDAPGRMRDDWTIDGSHPSLRGHRRLGELAFRPPADGDE